MRRQEDTLASTFVVISSAGPARDLSVPVREQPLWDEHAEFIDALVAAGFLRLAGPLVDEGGALQIVEASDADQVRATLAKDPWYEHGILKLESVRRIEIFVDAWK